MIKTGSTSRFTLALISLCISSLVGTSVGDATFKPPINDTIERGAVYKECKTCPYSLCTNAPFTTWPTSDPYTDGVTLECWTRGTSIGNDTTWLRTTDGCYLSQYDLTDRNSTWENDLSYCGPDSEKFHITRDDARTRYDTECNLCPVSLDCVPMKYLKYETDITVTCWTDQGREVLGNTNWLKTTDNCYVAEIGLWEKADKDVLENCGPVEFLELNSTYAKRAALPEPTSLPSLGDQEEVVAAPEPTAPPFSQIPVPSLKEVSNSIEKRYLVNFTIGEEYSYCRSCPDRSCEVEKVYEFNQSVILMCWLLPDVGEDWVHTTDICWIPANETWEDLHDNYYYPTCQDFNDTGDVPPAAAPVKLN